jgi:hypothetical protein
MHGAASTMQDLTVEEQFIAGVSAYESVEEAWRIFDVGSKGVLSRSDFKRVIHKTLGIVCSDAERKQLRAKMDPQKTTRIISDAFKKFVVDSTQGSHGGQEEAENDDGGRLAVLPMDVPTLPDRLVCAIAPLQAPYLFNSSSMFLVQFQIPHQCGERTEKISFD